MAWLPGAAANATDRKMIGSQNGNSMFVNGAFYVLKSQTASYTNSSTETSMFTNDTSTTTPIVVYAGAPGASILYPGSTRVLPPGALADGTMFNFDFFGSIVNTGTPNFQVRLGLVNSAGTFTAIADTTATAMTNEGTACFLHISGGFNVQKAGTSGTLNGWCGYEYAPTAISVFSPVLNTTSFDTTQQYTIDIRWTFSAASTSNIAIVNYGAIEVIG